MKGKTGVSMQGIEHRNPKTFNGRKAVLSKDCKHLTFNNENITMPTKASFIKKIRAKNKYIPTCALLRRSACFIRRKECAVILRKSHK